MNGLRNNDTVKTPVPTDSRSYPVGETLGGRYFVQRQLGQGGIGAVYLALDNRLYFRPVVVKVLLETSSRSEHLVDRFKKEGEALARIKHSGVVKIFDLGELPGGKPYLVMEFVEGKTLADEMHDEAMEFQRAAGFIRQIAQALFAAHFEGVLHRDLKPANVMIERASGGAEQAKLIDFGIAKLANPISADATHTRLLMGTPAYIAPEQIESEALPASDIYALGVIAYEMLTAHRPFNVDPSSLSWPIELLNQQRAGVRTKPKDLRADLPDAAQQEILKALAYDPANRHQHPFELGESLSRALTNHNHIASRNMDLASLTLDLGTQSGALTFGAPTAKPAHRAVESFEHVWSNATFTDRIWPVTLDIVQQDRTWADRPGMGKKLQRGLGAKPQRVQYAYPLGSELCLAFDIDREGYLTLLDEGPEGIFYCLCPSQFAPNPRLDGRHFYLPQEGSHHRAFELTGAPGKERLLAIITKEPLELDWLPRDTERPSRVLSGADLELLLVRLQELGEGRWTALSSYFDVIA